jgi:hypothetical protein
MRVQYIAFVVCAALMFYPATLFANDDPCAIIREPFSGYWWGGQVQIRQHLAGVPLVIVTRFSYREIRHSPCLFGTPSFPPGVGEASISIGVPVFDHRRGGLLLRMNAQGQGSQKPGEPISGVITGAPSMAGHLNLWETPFPLIQLTGAASAAIAPSALDFPVSVAYLGGFRIYPVYTKHVQTNVGLTIGGSNAFVNFIPAFGFRASDFVILRRRIAIGAEFRTPISLIPGPSPYEWRFWGALTLAIDEIEDAKTDRTPSKSTTKPSADLVHTAPESAPPTQTSWETPL